MKKLFITILCVMFFIPTFAAHLTIKVGEIGRIDHTPPDYPFFDSKWETITGSFYIKIISQSGTYCYVQGLQKSLDEEGELVKHFWKYTNVFGYTVEKVEFLYVKVVDSNDPSGNTEFKIIRSDPQDGATDVPIDVKPKVWFNQDIGHYDVNPIEKWVYIMDDDGKRIYVNTKSVNNPYANEYVAEFTPHEELEYGKHYVLVVPEAAYKGGVSETPLSEFRLSFTTENRDYYVGYGVYSIGGYFYILDQRNKTAKVTRNADKKYAGNVVIPASVRYKGVDYAVETISNAAFADCNGLTSITLPNSLTTIENLAFDGCSGLTSITIPQNVSDFGYEVFFMCDNLTSIIVDDRNAVYDSREGCNAIIKTNTNELVAGCSTTFIPNSVTSIADAAFARVSNLRSITIPNSVTIIESNTFWDCKSLASISIPQGVTAIGKSAFSGCASLTIVTLPPALETISEGAFSNTGLKKVEVLSAIPPTALDNVFTNYDDVMLVVPHGTKDAYQAVSPWNKFTTIVESDYSDIYETIAPKKSVSVFNLQGRKVRLQGENSDSPPKGLYVINGRKVVVH